MRQARTPCSWLARKQANAALFYSQCLSPQRTTNVGTVAIHPPKTPITSGFNKGTAKNTIPNVCKMPGPPAPFVPTPLPNIAKSNMSPKGFSKDVKIEGKTVAIFGASFKSMGDVASKATGGGLLSMNTHGPAKFVCPGSLTVKIEGKAVHLKGDPI